jgi:hypothetical protein
LFLFLYEFLVHEHIVYLRSNFLIRMFKTINFLLRLPLLCPTVSGELCSDFHLSLGISYFLQGTIDHSIVYC